MKPKQLLPGIALIAVLVALRLTSGTQGQPGPASAPPQPEPMPMPGLAGTASCSARGCHGGILPRKGQLIEQDEYTLWLTQDKHAQAYEVLLGPRSQEIESKLGGKLSAHDDVRCLACHVTPAAVNDSSFAAREERLSGVGCEACHGYARQWLNEHTTATWKNKTPQEKRAYGMAPLTEPRELAQQCTGCHIGAPAQGMEIPVRDMNHDLVAAGHPRLSFELGVFLANVPRHWSAQVVAGRAPDYEAKVWEHGQLASGLASLELLADRAAGADKGRPWPELSEYDCYSCHHDLTEPSWRQARQDPGARKPGSLQWSDWYLAMPRHLAAKNPSAPRDLLPALENLSRHMQQTYPDPATTRSEAARAAQAFKTWLDHFRAGPSPQHGEETRNLLLEQSSQFSSWDSAEQLYLALVALNETHPEPAALKILDDMGRLLAFPREYASPKEFCSVQSELAKRVEMLRRLRRR